MASYEERLRGEAALRKLRAFEKQEHITDGSECWCRPRVETLEDGSTLTVHNE